MTDKLKDVLRQWIGVSTWYTKHPCDEKRFHQVLQNAFSMFGASIESKQFKEAMIELANELWSDLDNACKMECVMDYALRAEHVFSFLKDVQEA